MQPFVLRTPVTAGRNNDSKQHVDSLKEQIEKVQAELSQLVSQLRHHPNFEPEQSDKSKIPDEAVLEKAERLNKKRIQQLSTYNKIKDIGMGLVGLIAEREGKTMKAVLKERDMNDKE